MQKEQKKKNQLEKERKLEIRCSEREVEKQEKHIPSKKKIKW